MKIKTVEFIRSAPNWAVLPKDRKAEIAFAGRSNVGKSSLLNALIGRKNLARTSSTPGKTQALNYYLVNGPAGFYLVDLPGFGYAKVSKKQREAWQRLIGRYVTEREELRIIFHLIDSRHEPTRLDEELIEILRGSPVPRVILLTKSDKLPKNQQRIRVAQVQKHLAGVGVEVPVVLTSAEKKTGMDEVWKWVETLL
ncbi:MAG: YihA family ribosome biogenesis GTP-binding protein [Bacteroidetes bacterium]|nr:YihA family ribosome biogenesis GTP-binding protein [Bacteroidota bacterium]